MWIFGGVVVGDPHVQPRPFRQRDGLLELILILPGEIPIVDPEQLFGLAIWQRHRQMHLFGQVVGVRANAERFHVHR